MAASYETPTSTRTDVNVLGNSIGAVVSKVLAAKVMADKERAYAQKQAYKQGIGEEEFNAMVPRGEFFKKALVGEFGGFAVKKKKQELTALYRKGLLLGKISKNKRLRNKVIGQLKQSLIYSRANLKNAKRFRSQFDYNDYDTVFSPQDKKVPSTRKKVQNALGGGKGKRVSREQIIESIDAIAKSIERTAQSITQSSASVYGTLIVSNQLQADVAKDLKIRNSTLEDKLQKLVDVISNQTQTQKEFIDKKEDLQQERQLESKTAAASVEVPDDLRTVVNESRSYSTFANEQEMMDPYLRQPPEVKPVNSMVNDTASMEAYGYPKAERGGLFGKGGIELHGTEALASDSGVKIISGPDNGYLHKIDEPTSVIPLDNNFTQGERSAVDGKIRPKPKKSIINNKFNNTQSFELGTANTLPQKASSTFNSNTQMLMDAMRLTEIAVGGKILATTTEFINSMETVGDNLRPEIAKISRGIASGFNLPSSITTKASKTKLSKKQKDESKDKKDTSESRKSFFEKLKEGFGKLLEKLNGKVDETENLNRRPGVTGPGVDFSNNKPSVEIPVEQNVMDTFESTENWSVYRETIASKESSGSYDPTPGRGGGAGGNYEGRYQINHEYLDDIAKILKENAPTREQFRADPKMQERFMQAYTMDNDRILKAYSPKYKKMSKKEQMAVLAYAHSQGAGAAADWVESGMGAGTKDQFGTPGRWYFENVQSNLEKYSNPQQTSNNPPQPSPTQRLGQQIKNNFGMGLKDRFYFTHNNQQYNAFKTTRGFDFYEGSRHVTDQTEEQGVINSFIKARENLISPPKKSPDENLQSSASKSSTPSIAMLNTMPTQSSTKVVTPPEFKVAKGENPLNNSGLYLSA